MSALCALYCMYAAHYLIGEGWGSGVGMYPAWCSKEGAVTETNLTILEALIAGKGTCACETA